MKTFAFVILSVILSATATPLGDRVAFRRHNGTPLSRRYILQSRTDAPSACIAPSASGTTTTPDITATGLPVTGTTGTDNSTDTSDVTGAANSTVVDPSIASNTTLGAADNSTAVANTTVAANSTAPASRRFWARHGGFGFGSFGSFGSFSSSDVVSEHTTVSVSFEETVSSFVETWEDLCLESGGDIYTGDPCTNLGGDFGIDALSEYADPCDQQIIADNMITFAKSHGIRNRDALINYAISFRRHPRHAVEILGSIPSSLYCLTAPSNTELSGIYNDQIDGVNPGLYGSPTTPLVPFGSSGTCPFGMTADVSSCGCVGSDGTTDVSDGTDDSSDDSTDDSTDSSDATATDSADDSTSTDATSTDTTDAPLDTDTADASTSTADAASAVITPPPSSPTDVNVQPTDISGNVNDPNGRR